MSPGNQVSTVASSPDMSTTSTLDTKQAATGDQGNGSLGPWKAHGTKRRILWWTWLDLTSTTNFSPSNQESTPLFGRILT